MAPAPVSGTQVTAMPAAGAPEVRAQAADSRASSTVPVTVRVQPRLEDLSPAGHIGNAAIVQIIEEARSRFFRFGGEDPSGGPADALLGPLGSDREILVAQQTVEYTAEMFYRPDPLLVDFWIGRVGGSSITVDAEIRAEAGTDPLVRTESVIVIIDVATSRPAPIDEGMREHFARFRGEPVALRPRPGADR